MPEYPKDVGRFALFTNDKKQAGTKQPDYNGNIELEEDLPAGKYRVNGWKTPTKNDPKKVYLSGKIAPMMERQDGPGRSAPPPKQDEDDNDSVPF